MVQQLMDSVHHTMRHALEVEEKIPLEQVTDFEEVSTNVYALNVEYVHVTVLSISFTLLCAFTYM